MHLELQPHEIRQDGGGSRLGFYRRCALARLRADDGESVRVHLIFGGEGGGTGRGGWRKMRARSQGERIECRVLIVRVEEGEG